MPIYMDRHYMEGVTRHVLANAHEKDLQNAGKIWSSLYHILV